MTGAGLIVAGAGAAGLATALAATEGGADVVLIEARESFRTASNTAMSTSMIPAGGSRWQREAGIADSPERFREDVRRKTRGQADPTVTQALTDVAPELVVWLHDRCGVPLGLVTDFSYPGHSYHRCHAVPDRSGRTLLRHLLDEAGRRDGVTLMCPMHLDDVVTDVDGRVTGVRVSTPSGAAEQVDAEAVVLATNGFGADRDLVRRHLPQIAGGLYHGGDGSRGDALRIGQRLGADLRDLDAYQGHGSVATPHGTLLTWATVMHGAVLVNGVGERFGDETVGYSEFGARTLAQPGGVAWMVFDERIAEACRPFVDFRDILDAGAVRWAADAEELAMLIGAGPDEMARTLAAADDSAAGRAADPFGRKDWEAPLSPPYAAVKVTGALFHTQGGLAVDRHARVLRGGEPVPGLYAAGGAAVGMSGHCADGYLAGNGLLAALGLGYLAGRHASGAAGGSGGLT